jgi:hypothetical protein
MATRARLSKKRRHDDPDATYMSSWAPRLPRAMRKCAGRKNYTEIDSEPEDEYQESEDEYIRDPVAKRSKHDDDVIIDEERSTPAPGFRGWTAVKSQVQLAAAQMIFQKTEKPTNNGGNLFKSLPAEVCCIFTHMIPACPFLNPSHLHIFVCILLSPYLSLLLLVHTFTFVLHIASFHIRILLSAHAGNFPK